MRARSLHFLIPGDLGSATGGYGYDRRIIEGLRQLGWSVEVRALAESFPLPSSAALEHADAVLSDVPDDGVVMVDGLAFGAMPRLAARHAQRLRIVALVHHPLAAEPGLSRELAEQFAESERASLRVARHVVVTSEATAAALESYGVDRSRISVIVPGTDEAALAPGSSDGITRLLCVGAVTPRKGYDVLIDSLAPLASMPWTLACVGSLGRDTDAVAAIRDRIQRAGLQEKVTLAGELSDDAVQSAFREADIFVLATRHEGYGMAVAEALARGIPVISTRTGAIPDLVGHAAGLLVSPGDASAFGEALARVLHTPALLAPLREGAREARARLPRWPQSCGKMSQILEQKVSA